MNPREFIQLKNIRKDLADISYKFPNGCCLMAACAVKRDLGYEIIRGEFSMNKVMIPHYWNETPQGDVIDLTIQQFSESFPEVLIIKKESGLFKAHYIYRGTDGRGPWWLQ